MSGYYPPNANLPPQYYNINPNVVPGPNAANAPPMMAPDGSYAHGIPESPIYHSMPGSFIPYADPQMQQPYMGQYEEVPGAMDSSQGGNARVRRRPGPGDQVKHRRTRSGCYTCRQRRVKVSLSPTRASASILTILKCDETHPMCDSKCTTRVQVGRLTQCLSQDVAREIANATTQNHSLPSGQRKLAARWENHHRRKAHRRRIRTMTGRNDCLRSWTMKKTILTPRITIQENPQRRRH
jgi:hypothetical protein